MKPLTSIFKPATAFKQILGMALLSASLGAHPALAADAKIQITASKGQQAGATDPSVTARRVEMDEARILPRGSAIEPGQTESATSTATDTATPEFQKRAAHYSHAYIDSAAVTLDADYDGDGFYTQISVDFDVDTELLVADVYARLYLSLDFGPWVEYAVTDDFTVLGASGSDGYYIDTDLVEGFLPGFYDLRIEVFDAYDDELLASFDADDSSALATLALEDELADEVEVFIESETIVTVSSGGGGSTSILLLLGLALLAAARRSIHAR